MCPHSSSKNTTLGGDSQWETNGAHHQDREIFHNCTTWGGNSGGPILTADSRLALGLPAVYFPDHNASNPIPSDWADGRYMGRMDLIPGFIMDHEQTLRNGGVVIR